MDAQPDDSPKVSRPKPRDAALSPTLHQELHGLTAGKMQYQRDSHTTLPTALVEEAYLRLAGACDSMWSDRANVLGMATHVMRHILVDHTRAHRADKRGRGAVQVRLGENLEGKACSEADVLAVDEALKRLREFDPRRKRSLKCTFGEV